VIRTGTFLLAVFLLCASSCCASVGFQQVVIPDPQGKPIAVAIWYPSNSPAASQPLGMFFQTVAADGEVAGAHLPLVVISHGNAGSSASHYDTALALAEAGFVVAALTHTGDNYMDQSYAGNRIDLIDRPRQVKCVTDYMISTWKDRARLDAGRIGIFGFSLGGFTALVEAGGVPDLSRMADLCAKRPDAPECGFIAQRHGDQLEPATAQPTWVHDTRIRAAIVAAPAAIYLLGTGGLKQVRIPVLLWRAEKDSQAPDSWNSGIVRSELPAAPVERVVHGADHFIFLAPCNTALAKAAPTICEDPPGLDRAAFHRDFNRAVVEFFRNELAPVSR
jgi:predicted dienelactone hydrolase